MAMIGSLVDNKIQALKDVTKGYNCSVGGHQNLNNGSRWNTCNKNCVKKVCFVEHPDKYTHNLK